MSVRCAPPLVGPRDVATAECDTSGHGAEDGFVSLWVLYWALIVLFLAGFGIDLWRGVAVRRSIQEQAEAGAAAGANAVPEDTFRRSGDVVIDDELAELLAGQTLLAHEEFDLIDDWAVTVADGEVTGEGTATVDFTLVKLFLPAEKPLQIDAAATAAPRIGGP